MTQLLVKEIMTKETKSISPDTVLPETHQAMIMNNIRRLPVMKGDKLMGNDWVTIPDNIRIAG